MTRASLVALVVALGAGTASAEPDRTCLDHDRIHCPGAEVTVREGDQVSRYVVGSESELAVPRSAVDRARASDELQQRTQEALERCAAGLGAATSPAPEWQIAAKWIAAGVGAAAIFSAGVYVGSQIR